ncbi:MAG: beta-N-acetylhexosaminidase [Candidatus Omnitrophica bacterium]|nr:beta-N-acetylhexosaminidase [Candidatus Omnitrophota bacterium]
MANLEEMVGQHLMIGIKGSKLTPEMAGLFKETSAGGLILFRPNFSTAEGFKTLIKDLEAALGRRLIVAVDHEGGRVIHLAENITVFPDNLAFGYAGSEAYAAEQGAIEAAELRHLGIDINLAPTLDVLTQTFSPNIGIRSYGMDPNLVARFGSARIRSMQRGGLSACAKHFPGQGHSQVDTHEGLPVLAGSWDEMKESHIRPFAAAISAGVDAVMTSHPVYPGLDHLVVPATFSRRIVHDLLRKELGFDGVILSDDLGMGALKDICSIGESACRAVAAGHDVVLVCHNESAQREAFRSLVRGYRNGRLNVRELEQSMDRLEAMKLKRGSRFGTACSSGGRPPGPAVPNGRFGASADITGGRGVQIALDVAQKAVRVFGASAAVNMKQLPLPEHTLVIFPRISSLADLYFIENAMLNDAEFVRSIFDDLGVSGTRLEVRVVNFDPADSDIHELSTAAAQKSLTVFFCFDAHLFPQTQRLLRSLEMTAKSLVVVLLRDPFDKEFVPDHIPCITGFGFRTMQIKAAVKSLFTERSISL